VLVVDASVLAPAVADAGPDGDACRARLKGHDLAAPDLLRVEVASVLRRQLAHGALSARQAANAIDDLLQLPVEIYPTTPLLWRTWQLRDNLTAYDSCYVALAEALGCPLITADHRLVAAPGSRCRFDLV
jgi:predicted nucleic acid-binding protein